MEKITFISVTKGWTNISGGFAVDYRLSYFKEKAGYLKDIKSESIFKITFTDIALASWGVYDCINVDKLIKLSFPFAVEWISSRVKDGTLKEFEEKIISSEDNIDPYPFDIEKIEKIEGYEITFSTNNTDIGTRIKTNIIADTIIELRDNINALTYSKHKENLLFLVQERNILNLFRRIDNREQFSYAISSLGNLASDMNTKLLRKLTNNDEEDVKSLRLLELFLGTIDDEKNNIIEILKTINRIRQGYPVHSDKTGIIQHLKKFDIDYPIIDYDLTWQILLEKYNIALEELLEKIKKYAA
jgi:hypothetical protein